MYKDKMNRREKVVEILTAYVLNEVTTTRDQKLSEGAKLSRLAAKIKGDFQGTKLSRFAAKVRDNFLKSGVLEGVDFERWILKNKPNLNYTAGTELGKDTLGDVDTRHALLSHVHFPDKVKFTGDWSFSEFQSTSLIKAKFINGNFKGVNFAAANLTMADLSDSFFDGADFSHAILYQANLSPAESIFSHAFSKADFTHAILTYSKLQGADLSKTINLHTAALIAAEYDDFTIFPDNFEHRYPEKYRSMLYTGNSLTRSMASDRVTLQKKYGKSQEDHERAAKALSFDRRKTGWNQEDHDHAAKALFRAFSEFIDS